MTRQKDNENIILSIPGRLPFLSAICWQTKDVRAFSPVEMLERYERGWRYRGVVADLDPEEREFVKRIATHFGSWIINDV